MTCRSLSVKCQVSSVKLGEIQISISQQGKRLSMMNRIRVQSAGRISGEEAEGGSSLQTRSEGCCVRWSGPYTTSLGWWLDVEEKIGKVWFVCQEVGVPRVRT